MHTHKYIRIEGTERHKTETHWTPWHSFVLLTTKFESMQIYMCIYIYMYIYIHMYMYFYVNIYMCICMCIYMCIYIHMHMYIYEI